MPAWSRPRSLLSLSLLSALLLVGACHKTTSGEPKRPGKAKVDKQAKQVVLPDPLALPAQPKAASWIADPQRGLGLLTPYSPMPVEMRGLAQLALGTVTEPALAEQLAGVIDPARPFANVVLDGGEEVIRLSVAPDQAEQLKTILANLESAGEFGAVQLPPALSDNPQRAGHEWLAWIDQEDEGALVLSNSLPGLVTGRHLAAAYGSEPIFFTIDPGSLPIPVEIPFSRIEAHGDFSKVAVTAVAREGQDPLAGVPIQAGTLGGLLEGKGVVAGASTRYADHEEAVRQVIVEVNAQVAELPFLVRGVGEDLAAKLNTTLRTWDGRVLVAMGPRGHLRVAYGAKDPTKSRVAMLRLLQTVVDNVSVARSFVSNLPRLTLRRRVATGGGQDVEMFVIGDAAANLPRELRALTDGEGRLNIAMSWAPHAGGGQFVIGPNADKELAAWLEETKDAPSAEQTQGDLLAASFAADPQQLQAVLANFQPGQEPDQAAIMAALLGLDASGPRWGLQAKTTEPGQYELVITPPASKPPRARH